MSYQYQENLPAAAGKRYYDKLVAVGLKQCPYQLPADAWIEDPKKWPDIEYPDVVMYLTSTAGKFPSILCHINDIYSIL